MKVDLAMSGKGGVGKTTIAVNLAKKLAGMGKKVGIMDADLTSSSVAKLMGIPLQMPKVEKKSVVPFVVDGIRVIAVSMFTGSEETPVFFKGEKKRGWIEQFIDRVDWGDTEYLIVDCPPGHSDEVIELLTTMKNRIHKAVIVTTSKKLALNSVQKTIRLCQRLKIPIAGLIANKTYISCPNCHVDIPRGNYVAVEQMAKKYGVPIIASVPDILEQEVNAYSIVDLLSPVANELTTRRLF